MLVEVAEEEAIPVACDRVAAAGFASVEEKGEDYERRPYVRNRSTTGLLDRFGPSSVYVRRGSETDGVHQNGDVVVVDVPTVLGALLGVRLELLHVL